jgi:hypothetical protein
MSDFSPQCKPKRKSAIDSPDGQHGLIRFSESTSRIRSKTAPNGVRVKANFVSGIKLILVVQICAPRERKRPYDSRISNSLRPSSAVWYASIATADIAEERIAQAIAAAA